MTVYVSRRDETVKVKLIKYEEKFKTYLVEYLNGERKGKTTSFSSSTMKRWWKQDVSENVSMNETKKDEKLILVDKEVIIKCLSNKLGVDFIEYPSTPGLYKPNIKPASFRIGLTKTHVTVYFDKSDTIKISYDESDYISKVVKLFT